jgi:hypothetical protein
MTCLDWNPTGSTLSTPMSTTSHDLAPDANVLQHLFPNSIVGSTTFFSQMWQMRTFIALVDESDQPARDIVVHLEVFEDEVFHLSAISDLQRVAALAISDLVPKVK